MNKTDTGVLSGASVNLLRSEERLRLALEATRAGVWDWNIQTGQTYCSPDYFRMLGYDPADFSLDMSSLFLELLHPEDRDPVMAKILEQIESPGHYEVEFRMRDNSGCYHWISSRGRVVERDPTGKPWRAIGTHVDITARKEAEQALRKSEERLELALRGADLGFWDWDICSGAVFFSDRWITMLGYSREDIEPVYSGWERLVHPDDIPRVLSALKSHLAGNSPFYEIEHRLLTKDCSWKWVWSSGRVWERDAQGLPLRAAGTDLDITQRKELEERLRQKQAQLNHAQRLTTAGELAATIVHELNQPLGAISSYVGSLKLEFADLLEIHPTLKETLEETLRLTQRASGVVRGIRDLVRRRESRDEWVDIDELLTEIMSYLHGEILRRQVRLQADLSTDLPKVRGHRIQLQQLFLNLILNALDAMDEVDSNRRTLSLKASLSSPTSMSIRISDTGPGIEPEIANRLFEPFLTTKATGIGLGLPVCRTIAQTHGGSITADTVSGRGACFEVRLPVIEGDIG